MSAVSIKRRGPGRPIDPARQQLRREEILDAAARVFAERGYSGADVAQVAEIVGLTKASIYHYFESKEKLFFATVDATLGELADTMAHLADQMGDRLDGIREAASTYLRFFAEHPDAVELMIEERSSFKTRANHTYFTYREAALDKWVRVLDNYIALGLIRPVPPVTTLRLLTDLLYGRVITNFFVGDPRSPEEQGDEIIDVLMQGLSPRD